jgi:hypothetical protein
LAIADAAPHLNIRRLPVAAIHVLRPKSYD